MGIIDCRRYRGIVVARVPIPTSDVVRRDTARNAGVELIDLVVSVTVINGAALAERITIDHATNVGVVVQLEVAAAFRNGLELFLCAATP